MLSESTTRTMKRKLDNERRMAKNRARELKVDFAKRLGKAIGAGIFSYITMITGQVAAWIAIPLIGWSLCYGSDAVDRYMDRRIELWRQ